MPPTSQLSPSTQETVIVADRLIYTFSHHWMLVFSMIFGVFVSLPFLAPVFMQLGFETPARGIYFFYSFQCHQLPERSFFLFGPEAMYGLRDIQTVWQNTFDPFILRGFIGSSAMGWKVAWSDRMVYMYTSLFVFAWVWWFLRRRVKPLHWWGLALFLLPMAIDGITHIISDFAGIGQGFRYDNAWLAALTGNLFSRSFYIGDAFGSFNSWMRLLTGLLFGLGVVWFAFPYANHWFKDMAHSLEAKFERAGLRLK